MLNSIRENIERRLGIASRPAPVKNAKIVESLTDFSGRFKSWRANDDLNNYPFSRKHERAFYADAPRFADAESRVDFVGGRVY